MNQYSHASCNKPLTETAIASPMPVAARVASPAGCKAPHASAVSRQMFSRIGAAAAAAKRDSELRIAATSVARLMNIRYGNAMRPMVTARS